MRYGRSHRPRAGVLSFNATPLVDVVFLLTIFFMLITRFSSAEHVRMQLPQPTDSRAKVTKIPERIIINCRLAPPADPQGRNVIYSVGPNAPVSLDSLSNRLAALKREQPKLSAVIRADRRLHYADVRAVMQIIADQGIEMLNVAAHVSEDE